jgi:hypothetical protein
MKGARGERDDAEVNGLHRAFVDDNGGWRVGLQEKRHAGWKLTAGFCMDVRCRLLFGVGGIQAAGLGGRRR